MTISSRLLAALFTAGITTANLIAAAPVRGETPATPTTTAVAATQVKYGTIAVDGLNIAYREAGDPKKPKLVLLHGWPHRTSTVISSLHSRLAST